MISRLLRHRLFPVWCPALLYGALLSCATAAHGADAAGTSSPAAAPHIALLLPLDSLAFARHSAAVKQGFLAAAQAQRVQLPIRVYSVDEDTQRLLTVYEQAIEAGARLVVGPLTRRGVNALAASGLISVPTLALSFPAPGTPQPPRLYLFGLAIENEARQTAQLAFDAGRRNALIVGNAGELSTRMRDTFAAEFSRRGGHVVGASMYEDGGDPARLFQAAGGNADMVFLALDAAHAGAARAYLPPGLEIYATSQVNDARGDASRAHDLEGVRFVDMPWLLQPDHPAVMVYPRMHDNDNPDLERMYALGIDAFRIGTELLQQKPDLVLDGVTGRIRLSGSDHQFVRELTPARFTGGAAVPDAAR